MERDAQKNCQRAGQAFGMLGRVKVFGGHPGGGRPKFGTHSTADNQDGLRLCALQMQSSATLKAA